MTSREVEAFIKIKFAGKNRWGVGVEKIVDAHPNEFIEPTGDLELIVSKSLEHWVNEELKDLFSSIEDLDADYYEAAQDTAKSSALADRGKGVLPKYDDPDWLARTTQKIKDDNERLRSRMRA